MITDEDKEMMVALFEERQRLQKLLFEERIRTRKKQRELMREASALTVDKIAEKFDISKGSAYQIIRYWRGKDVT